MRVNRKLFSGAIVVMLSLIFCASGTRAEMQSPIGIIYDLTIDDLGAAKHVAHVSMTIPQIRSPSLTLVVHPFLIGRIPLPITNFTAINEKGESLTFYKPSQIQWIINAGSTQRMKADYNIAMNISEPVEAGKGGYLNYLGKDFGLSIAAWVFLVPSGMEDARIEVNFNLPNGWRAYAPWDFDGGHYIIDSLKYFATSTFAVGKFESFSEVIGNTNVTIAVYVGWDEKTRREFATYSFRCFEYVSQVFQTPGVPRHLCIYVPRVTNEQNLAMEWSQSQGTFVGPLGTLSAIVGSSHRFFHIYNCFPPIGMQMIKTDEEDWIKEGINRYYQMDKILIKLGLLRRHEQPLIDYREYQTKYLGTNNDFPIAKLPAQDPTKNYDAWIFATYKKGELVGFVLDETIRKITGNKSLDDVLAYLYREYGCFSKPRQYWPDGFISKDGYSNRDLLRVINDVSGQDFSRFFEEYVYGIGELPLKIEGNDLVVDWQKLLRTVDLSRVSLMTLSLSLISAKPGETIELYAKLATIDGRPIANQTVAFYLNSTLVGSATTDQSGLATLSLQVPAAGTYQVVVRYAGSQNLRQSTDVSTLTVVARPSTIQTTTPGILEQQNWLQLHLPVLVTALVVVAVLLALKLRGRKNGT